MSTTESADETSTDSDEQQYEQVVLIATGAARFGDKRDRIEGFLGEVCADEQLPLAGHEFADDRLHLYVANPEGHPPEQLTNLLRVRTQQRYRRQPRYEDGLRWRSGLHAGTVAEDDLP